MLFELRSPIYPRKLIVTSAIGALSDKISRLGRGDYSKDDDRETGSRLFFFLSSQEV